MLGATVELTFPIGSFLSMGNYARPECLGFLFTSGQFSHTSSPPHKKYAPVSPFITPRQPARLQVAQSFPIRSHASL